MKRTLGFILLSACAVSSAYGDGNEVNIKKISAVWTERESRLSRVNLQIEWKDTQFRPENSKKSEEKTGPTAFGFGVEPPSQLPSTNLLQASRGRLRIQSSTLGMQHNTQRYEPLTKTTVWQGKQGKSLHLATNSVSDNYGRISRDPQRLIDVSVRAPYLALWPLNSAYGNVPIDEYELDAKSVSIDGIENYVLRRKDGGLIETEVYVDPATEFGIRRVISKSGQSVTRQLDIEYENLAGVGWLPFRWELVMWNVPGAAVSFRIDAKVTSTRVLNELKDDAFDISFPPGTRVREMLEGGGSRLLIVAPNGKLVPFDSANTTS